MQSLKLNTLASMSDGVIQHDHLYFDYFFLIYRLIYFVQH